MALNKDQKSSMVVIFLAVVLIIASVKASLGSFSKPGSGLLPFLSALLLGFFSLVIFVAASLRKNEGKKDIFRASEISWKNVIVTLGAMVAFPFSLKVVGFNLTVFWFILFLLKSIEPRSWAKSILFALMVMISCYFVFIYWFGFFVEKGIFGL